MAESYEGTARKKLSKFLEELDADESKLRRYRRSKQDREDVLKGSGLSEEHQELLRNNDLDGVNAELEKEDPQKVAMAIFAIF